MITIDVRDHNALKGILAAIAHLPKAVPASLSRAINKTLRDVRKEAVRIAQTTYTARAADLSRTTVLSLAKAGHLTGRMTMSDTRGLGLINFRAKPNKPGEKPSEGVSVQVARSGGRATPRKHGKKAFVAKGRSGNTHLFVRTKPGPGGMQALYGPHPIQAFGRDENEKVMDRLAETLLPVNLQREVDLAVAQSVKGVR